MKRVISGVLMLGFALLGAYCSAQAIRINRQLNGRPDIHDSIRNWSTGATACFVACGVVGTAGGRGTSSSRRNPALIVLAVAVLVVVVIGVVMLLQPSPRPVSPVQLPQLPAPAHPSPP